MSSQTRHGSVLWVSSHARRRWRERTDQPGADLRQIWRQSTPVEYAEARGAAYVRYHSESDTLLIAENGNLTTVIDLTDRPLDQQRDIREQAQEGET